MQASSQFLVAAMMLASGPVPSARAQPAPLAVTEISSGVFVHFGEVALMTPANARRHR